MKPRKASRVKRPAALTNDVRWLIDKFAADLTAHTDGGKLPTAWKKYLREGLQATRRGPGRPTGNTRRDYEIVNAFLRFRRAQDAGTETRTLSQFYNDLGQKYGIGEERVANIIRKSAQDGYLALLQMQHAAFLRTLPR